VNSRPSILLIVLSLLFGLGVLFLFINALPPERGEGFAVLSVDAGLADREIGALLEKAGLGGYYSESTQTLSVDGFGEMKSLALDRYREELEPFDPRDDGYGEVLRSFFVRDGKRYFFVPLENTAYRGKIERAFAVVLEGVPFDLDILGNPRPFFRYFLICASAVLGAFCLSREKRRFIPQLPVLLAFGWCGVTGITLAGILVGLRGVVREALKEFFPLRLYGALGERLKPYRSCFILAGLFIFLFGFLCRLGEAPALPAAAGLLCFLLLDFAALGVQRRRWKHAPHIRFFPVPLLPAPVKIPGFRLPVAAFAAGAALAIFIPSLFSFGEKNSGFILGRKTSAAADSRYILSQEDYERHMAFEASFSFTPLGVEKSGNSPQEEYVRYHLSDDGLIGGYGEQPYLAGRDIPPFPLERLMEFLVQYNNNSGGASPVQLKDWISVTLILIICVPGRLRAGSSNGKKKKTAFLRTRRIAA
jgi:hypothetical protein